MDLINDPDLKEELKDFPHAPKQCDALGDATLKILQDHILAFHAATGMHIDSSNISLLKVYKLPMASIAGYLKKIHNSQAKADMMLIKGEMPKNAELWKNDYNLLFPKFWKEFVEFLHDKYKPVIARTKYAEFVATQGCWPPSTEDIKEFNHKYQSIVATSSGRGRKSGPMTNKTARQNFIRVSRQVTKLGNKLFGMTSAMEDMDKDSTKYAEIKAQYDILYPSYKLHQIELKEWEAKKAEEEKGKGKKRAAADSEDEEDDEDENLEANPEDDMTNPEDDNDMTNPEIAKDDNDMINPEIAEDDNENISDNEDPSHNEEGSEKEDTPPPPRRMTRHSQASQGSKRDTSAPAGITPSAKRNRI